MNLDSCGGLVMAFARGSPAKQAFMRLAGPAYFPRSELDNQSLSGRGYGATSKNYTFM
jgi:hypothetical protein